MSKFTEKCLMLLMKSFEWGWVEVAETSSILSKVRSQNDSCETRNNGLDSGKQNTVCEQVIVFCQSPYHSLQVALNSQT